MEGRGGARLIVNCKALALLGVLLLCGTLYFSFYGDLTTARRLVREGRFEEALEAYDRSVSRLSSSPGAHSGRAWVLGKLGRFEASLADYDRVLELNGESASIHSGRGFALSSLERWEEADRAFRSALELEPDDIYSLEAGGLVLVELERHEDAIELLDRWFQLHPHGVSTIVLREDCLIEVGRGGEVVASYPDYRVLFRNLEAVTGIRVIYDVSSIASGAPPRDIRCWPAELGHVARLARPLADELERYSREVLRKIELAEIVLCDQAETDREVGGLYHPGDGRVYLTARYAPAATRGAIHHEVHHVIDAYRGDQNTDPAWRALNPSDFEYSGHGDEFASTQPVVLEGFVSRYAMTDPQEDKSETFESLMMNRAWLDGRVAADPVIAAKVALLRERIERIAPGWLDTQD